MEEIIKQILKNKLGVTLKESVLINQGVSTNVFNINPKEENLYFRIQPIKDYAYSPIVEAHKLALNKGIKVPKVLYFEDYSELFDGKSFMVIESIKGNNLEDDDVELEKTIMFSAGRDLALFNTIPTEQFGWIERNSSTNKLYGHFSTLKGDLTYMLNKRLEEYKKREMLNNNQIEKINALVNKLEGLRNLKPVLNHTDISYAHIFTHNNKYTGIIDLDDIRGSHWMLDLAEASQALYRYDDFNNFLEGYKSIFNISEEELNFEFRLIRLFWFIEKGFWVLDFNPNPLKNVYYQIMLQDLGFLS